MKRVWLRKFCLLQAFILILSAGLISAAGSPTLAQPPEMVKVLVGFDIQPGPSEEALVHAKGGRVRGYQLKPGQKVNSKGYSRHVFSLYEAGATRPFGAATIQISQVAFHQTIVALLYCHLSVL